MHKYGLSIPPKVKEAIEIDKENGDTLWWDAILQEMKILRPAFKSYEGNKEDLPPGYQQIKFHMIFDIKPGNNFSRKARLVGRGHPTTAPSSITFLLVVSRESFRIVLTIAALNDIDAMACDIHNTYLTALSRGNIWTFAGPEFVEEEGTFMLCKNGIIWAKKIRRSIPIQAISSTEGNWLTFHKRGP